MESKEENSSLSYSLLLPQAFVGLIDAVSYMVVAPSLVFYVFEVGGSKEQYGFILAAFSLASFAFKPVLGYWCDRSGYRFRAPYLVSLIAASLGGFFYFFAGYFPKRTALAMLFIGRFLGGMGAANNTLGFTYISLVIPRGQATKAYSVLSLVRVLGMAMAPGLNFIFSKVSLKMHFGDSFTLDVTPLNIVGLLMAFSNIISFLILFTSLKEPPVDLKPTLIDKGEGNQNRAFWTAMLRLEIMIPIFSTFALNANFQLLETGLAPAASNVLGWGPVGISSIFGLNSLLIFVVIIFAYQLSSWGVSDEHILLAGLCNSIIGYTFMYFLWAQGCSVWQFYIPVALATSAFPFLGAPTRSIYTRIVADDEHLRYYQGFLQAIMSMAASVAGFAAPAPIAIFVLRTPEEVDSSSDHREFTMYALCAPLMSLITLVGVVYIIMHPAIVIPDKIENQAFSGEATGLLAVSDSFSLPAYNQNVRELRRHTVTVMGISHISLIENDAKGKRRFSYAIA